MSRETNVRRRTSDETYTSKVVCDLCGKEAPHPSDWRPWAIGGFDVTETEVTMKTGEQYPECGGGSRFFFDVCPECFKSKVVPAMQALGAELQEEEWDS